MNKKYMVLLFLAMAFVLAAGLANSVQSQATYTDAVKINLLTDDRGVPDYSGYQDEGIAAWPPVSPASPVSTMLPFVFNPKPTFIGITKFWITIVYTGLGGKTVTLILNGASTSFSPPHYSPPDPWQPMVYTRTITSTAILQAVSVGINNATLSLSSTDFYTQIHLYAVDMFIEYQYSGAGGAVGGIVMPIDKVGLLAPYVGLTSTIIAATAASAIYIKLVKPRKEKQ